MITLAELKTYLKISDTNSDDQLNLAIDNAKGFLESYIGFSLELNAGLIASFSCYSRVFEVDNVNINAVSLIRSTDDEFNPTWVEYNDSANFRIFLDRGVVKTRDLLGPFVEITYSFGYDDTDCPADLKNALLQISASYFKNMGTVSMGDLKSESVDGDSIVYKDIAGSLTQDIKDLLDNYKMYGISA